MRKLLLLLAFSAVAAFGQCGKMALNPITGKMDCIGTATGGSMTWPSGAGLAAYSSGTAWATSVPLVTTLGSPGADTNVASEKAIRTAITAAIASITPTTLSLLIGTNTEAWSANLDSWSALATSAKQNALVNYSTISGLTGYPSTFAPINSGDWAGTWQTHAPSYFQTALGFTAVPNTVTVNGHALSSNVTVTLTDLSLNNVTNDAQTKAAIVPNTAPSAGQIHVGNAGGTAFAPVTMSGDGTMASTGAITITKTNGSAFGASATHGASTTVNGQTCTLDSTCTVTATPSFAGCHAYTYTSGTLTVDFSTYNCAIVTASGANPTLAFTAPGSSAAIPLTLGLCNDTTARTWTLPGTALQAGIPAVLSTCIYNNGGSYDGTNYQWPGSNETPSVIRLTSERAAPGTPAASTGVCWPDSTNHIFSCKENNSATVANLAVPNAGTSHNFLTAMSAGGVFSTAQPAFTDISGTATAAQLPAPTASTLGGIESITSASHNWVAYIDTSGVPHQGQPSFTDISGTATTSQLPVALANQTSINGLGITTSTGTLAIANAKTVTVSNTLTLAGTDSTTMTFPATSATIARTDAANTFTGHQTIEGVATAGATGTGNLVFATSPTLTAPTIGVATATSINKMAVTAPATSSTLAVADGKTLTASNTLTLAGTDSTTMTFPATSATIARTDAANTFTGHQTIEGVATAGATGTGNLVFATSPTLTTPTIGAATATTVNKITLTAPTTAWTIQPTGDNQTTTVPNGTLVNTAVATLSSLTAVGAITVTGHPTLEGVTSTGAQGTGALVFATSPTLTTPVIGAATGTSLLATGIVDGQAPVTVTTGSSATLGGTYKSGYTFNQEATAGTGVAYTLPTAAAGLQYCVANSYNGSAADTGVLTVAASASGQFIIFTDGTLSATGGNVTSGGAARDSACVVGVDSTHWMLYPSSGSWTKH